jgi:hypothetical protein
MNYTNYKSIFDDACQNINSGLTFIRDGKNIEISEILKDKIIVKLQSTDSLQNPTRSLSALTRYLTSNHSDIFREYVYNQTLFTMNLVNTKNISPNNSEDISDTEMLKTLIDLLYAFTAKSVPETQNRKKTINQIKELLRPYM